MQGFVDDVDGWYVCEVLGYKMFRREWFFIFEEVLEDEWFVEELNGSYDGVCG